MYTRQCFWVNQVRIRVCTRKISGKSGLSMVTHPKKSGKSGMVIRMGTITKPNITLYPKPGKKGEHLCKLQFFH